jgi:hypothetical protein
MKVGRYLSTITDDETRTNTGFFTGFPIQHTDLEYAVFVHLVDLFRFERSCGLN